MKKAILVFLFIIICVKASMAEKAYLGEYVKGKDTGRRIIADISLPDKQLYGKDHLIWHQIFISPVSENKDVSLTSQLFSVEDGSISNLNLSMNKITFRIDLSYYSPVLETGARYMDVVITTKMDGSIDDISGFSQWTDLKTNEIFNIQWKKALKHNFRLPYNIVY
jgi:hypothetical protein